MTEYNPESGYTPPPPTAPQQPVQAYPPPGYPGYPPPGYQPQWYAPYPPPPPVDPNRRPGSVTAAAILGWVAGGLLLFAAAGLFQGADFMNDFNDLGYGPDLPDGELVTDGVLNLILAGLLIAGGVMMVTRRSPGRWLYLGASAAVVVLSVYWAIRWNDDFGATSMFVFWSLIFAALVIVGSSLLAGAGVRTWFAAKH